jgi:putative ABC transport system permease protein
VIKVALRGLAGRKLRAALTAIAIVLGVAMMSGTFVLTDTIDKAFQGIFSESYANTDAVVSGKGADITFQGTQAETPPFPEELLDQVRALPDVGAASGSVTDLTNTKILTKEGKAVNTGGAPSFGIGLDPELSEFNPLKLLEGTWPASSGEVVIDVATADKEGYKIGDEVKIATIKPVESFKITGLAQYGEVRSLGSATFAVFTIPEAQRLLDRAGQLDEISVAAKEGVTPAALVDELKQELPPEEVTVRSAAEQTDEDLESVSFTKYIRYFLLAFAGIALIVGAFVIFNTLWITVSQRIREFATLRTIGASRRQLLTAVLIESTVIGIFASVVGLFIGFGLAVGLKELGDATGGGLPTAGYVFATRTVVVSLLVGVLVTVAAGLFPAFKATRVPPIAAVREGAEFPKGRLAPFTPYIALVVIGLAVVQLGIALFNDSLGTAPRLLSIAGGVLLLFVGVAMLSSKLVPVLSAAAAPVARGAMFVLRIIFIPVMLIVWGLGNLFGRGTERPDVLSDGQARRLAEENSRRNPGRTAATAAALMIGVALVTFVAVLASGFKASNRDAIEDQVSADYVITAQDGFTPFVAGAGDALADSSAAALVTPVRSGLGKVANSDQYITGIDPEAIQQVYTFDWAEGSDDSVVTSLGSDGAIVSKQFAEDHSLEIGDPVQLRSSDNKTARVEVKGIYEPPPFFPLLGAISIPEAKFDTLYERPRNQFVFANVDGDPTETTTAAIDEAVADFPDAKVQTRDAWIDQQDEDFNNFLSFIYVLLALAVIVSLVGMVNTLVLSVHERTRELGMLRAVGMTRRQARRMIRQESVITALIGATLGLPLGIFLAILVTKALGQFDVRISVPYVQLIVFAVVAIIVGVLAAIAPARRAAKLNVLRALQYE